MQKYQAVVSFWFFSLTSKKKNIQKISIPNNVPGNHTAGRCGHRPLRGVIRCFGCTQTMVPPTKKRYPATKPKNPPLFSQFSTVSKRRKFGIAEIPGGSFFLVLFFDIKEKEQIKIIELQIFGTNVYSFNIGNCLFYECIHIQLLFFQDNIFHSGMKLGMLGGKDGTAIFIG